MGVLVELGSAQRAVTVDLTMGMAVTVGDGEAWLGGVDTPNPASWGSRLLSVWSEPRGGCGWS